MHGQLIDAQIKAHHIWPRPSVREMLVFLLSMALCTNARIQDKNKHIVWKSNIRAQCEWVGCLPTDDARSGMIKTRHSRLVREANPACKEHMSVIKLSAIEKIISYLQAVANAHLAPRAIEIELIGL